MTKKKKKSKSQTFFRLFNTIQTGKRERERRSKQWEPCSRPAKRTEEKQKKNEGEDHMYIFSFYRMLIDRFFSVESSRFNSCNCPPSKHGRTFLLTRNQPSAVRLSCANRPPPSQLSPHRCIDKDTHLSCVDPPPSFSFFRLAEE